MLGMKEGEKEDEEEKEGHKEMDALTKSIS